MCDCAECRFDELLVPVETLPPERIYRLYGHCVNCGDLRYLDAHHKERCPVCNPEPPPQPEPQEFWQPIGSFKGYGGYSSIGTGQPYSNSTIQRVR